MILKRNLLLLALTLFSITACKVKTYRERNSNLFDITDQLNFLESNINNSTYSEFSIYIFFHQTINLLKTDFIVKGDSILIHTVTKINTETKLDTTFKMHKRFVFDEIKFQKKHSKDIRIIAGSSQWIRFVNKTDTLTYPRTRVAGYLMNFLESGETNNLNKTYNLN